MGGGRLGAGSEVDDCGDFARREVRESADGQRVGVVGRMRMMGRDPSNLRSVAVITV